MKIPEPEPQRRSLNTNLKHYMRQRLWPEIEDLLAQLQAVYKDADSPEHQTALQDQVMELLQKYHLQAATQQVLDHQRDATEAKKDLVKIDS